MNLHKVCSLAAAALLLVACGGGAEPAPQRTGDGASRLRAALLQPAPATPQRTRLAAAETPGVDADDAALQLLDFAEASFSELFPGPQLTRRLDGYVYRHYPQTSIYLGVRDGIVHVLGGRFGSAPLAVGPLTQYITPQALPSLCRSAGASYTAHATPGGWVGKNVALLVAGCRAPVTAMRWRQTAGPTLALVSERNHALSFVPAEAGDYRFSVDFVDGSGAARSESVAVAVAAPPAARARLALRASHAVRMGGPVSVRAWPQLADGDEVAGIAWKQIEGPAVELDTRDPHVAHFTAPEVAGDTLIRLRATLTTRDGDVDSDDVWVLVERHAQAAASDGDALWSGEHVSRVYAWRPQGRWAGVLQRCVYSELTYASGPRNNLCRLSELPFLAQETQGALPTVEQVMDRVLVSHDWLGRNFERLLREHDQRGDFRRMLQSVTAIVLGAQIRPSFYYAATGAIYLDANDFWLSAEERDTINERPDYRSAYDDALAFSGLWRYVRDGSNLFAFYDRRRRDGRSIDAVRDEAAPLLYHELAHALDYLPPSGYAQLNNALPVWSNLYPRWSRYEMPSDIATSTYPLLSAEMKALAQVQYRGDPASAVQLAYTPEQVAAFFDPDPAVDDYAYTDPPEDGAMVLEEALMALRLGVRRDVAYVAKYGPDDTARSILVRWGQRGRIGTLALRGKAAQLAQQMVPWLDAAEVLALPAPTPLRVGVSWHDNLGPPSALKRALQAPAWYQDWQLQHEMRRVLERRRTVRPLPPPPQALPPFAAAAAAPAATFSAPPGAAAARREGARSPARSR